MLKKYALVAGAGLALAALAGADMHNPALDGEIPLPDFELGPEGSMVQFTMNFPAQPIQAVGFTFSGTWDNLGTGAWASDMQLTIEAPTGETFSVGGFPSPGGENDWDFQGSGSSDPGTYTSTHFPAAASGGIPVEGTWTYTFLNTFGTDTAHAWSDVVITSHNIPTPSAVGLFGIAGLAAARRRR